MWSGSQRNPDHFTIHIETNDFTNDENLLKAIPDSITKLEISLLNNSHKVTISNIIRENIDRILKWIS